MPTTNKLIDEVVVEARQLGYNLCVIDARDILIRLKKKYPQAINLQLLFEFSDELDLAMAERKVTSMSIRETDFSPPQV